MSLPLLKSIGFAGLTPYELRQTAASLGLAEGANAKAVQRMLGHASAAMTLDVYGDLFKDDLDQVADRLDRPILTPSVRIAASMAEQGVCVVGRAGLEPATEGL